jgi:hypothetical protein
MRLASRRNCLHMPKAEPIATTLNDYLDAVARFEKRWKSDEGWLWYRGQGKAYWPLIPKLYRKAERPDRQSDDDIREEFITRAPSLTQEKPQNSWEWYFLMQHFGAATRLLDWTDGALIGLYFAVRDNPGYFDAAVWILDPWWLNRLVLHKNEVIPPGASGLWKKDEKRYRPWLRDRFDSKSRLPKWPVAIFPTQFDRRISTQRSCFTIHGHGMKGLDALRIRRRARLAKIVIPSYAIRRIKSDLTRCGLDEVSVFPDLQGLGRVVSERLEFEKTEKLPHDGVYTRLRPSKIHKGGIGVFAIRSIKKGSMIFSGENEEMLWVEEKDLPKAPEEIRKLYDDFTPVHDGRYGCPLTFNRLTPAWYLNDSKSPNVRADKNYDFFAVRKIKTGEELTVDSSTYSSHPASYGKTPAARRGRRPVPHRPVH